MQSCCDIGHSANQAETGPAWVSCFTIGEHLAGLRAQAPCSMLIAVLRTATLFGLALLVGLALSVPLAMRQAQAEGSKTRRDILPLSQVRAGMKGYGLTVFEGTKPEKFDVEVIGVQKGFLPRQDLILIKTRHPRLDVTRVVAGMSGSPIFLEGKMAGAYAYGWTFPREAVAGVTPIENMLSDLDRPIPSKIFGWPLSMVGATRSQAQHTAQSDASTRFISAPGHYRVVEHASQLAKRLPTLGSLGDVRPVETPMLLGGTNAFGLQIAETLFRPMGFEPLQAGGAGANEADAPERFVDGGSLGVQLVSGDVSAMPLGTVTRVEGDRLLGFGHPLMSAGITALPTAIAKVLWFWASEYRSFKVGFPVRTVGALLGDRQSSIVVSQSAKAPTIPVTLDVVGVEGMHKNTWHFQVAHEKFMAPSFLATAIGSAIQAVVSERRDVSWSLDSKVTLDNARELTLEDFGVSSGGTIGAEEILSSNLVSSTGALLNNPWQSMFVKNIHSTLTLHYARDILRLRGVQVLNPEVDAGKPVRLRVTLLPWEGPPQYQVLTVPLPAQFAGETVNIEVVPGYTETPETAAPETLGELISNLDVPVFSPKSLLIKYNSPGSTLAYRGRVASHLPPGAVDSLMPTTSSIAPTAQASPTRLIYPVSNYVVGKDRVTVRVKAVLR